VIRGESGLVRDPLWGDMSLVVDTPDGVVLLLGCCHAGLMNTIRHVRDLFPRKRLLAVMGGTHLASASEERLRATEAILREVSRIGLSHCTGIPVAARFMARFPERAFVFQVGTELEF